MMFLTNLQTGLRALQLTSSIIVLAIYSYTLGALSNRGLHTSTAVRAVEGIVGISVGYALACIVLLRAVRTRTFPAFVLIVLDVAFAGAWIYVATANGNGAGGCSGKVKTYFGKGDAGHDVKGKDDGFMTLPTYGDACRLLTACLAIAILTIFMYLGSIATTIFLGRAHHTEKRQTLTANPDDTSYPPLDSPKPGQDQDQDEPPANKKFSFKNLFRRRSAAPPADSENALEPHTRPSDLSPLHHQSMERDDDNDFVYVDPATGHAQSDIGLASGAGHGAGGYQRVQERPSSPETIYTEYDPQRPASPPPPMPQQFHAQPQPQTSPRPQLTAGDLWRPVDITGGAATRPAAGDEMSEARFPFGPYENLRAASVRGGYHGGGRQAGGQGAGYRYEDGVYDA